jgi:recombination protein RecT
LVKSQNNVGRDVAQHQPMTENEQLSAREKINMVLARLNERGAELEAVLPKDISLEAFLANVNTALRNNPKLLTCTFDSLIDACVKAAYDGLRIDGKEAAIVDSKERYNAGGNQWRERIVARYMPMVFGLIKQILAAGAALTVKAVIVYANEAKTGRFTLLEGTTPGIHHEPFVQGEERGEMIGAYAIAEVTRGVFKFEWMDKAAILDVQEESKTDKVWKRWPTEMWKKTVIRRLRKSLSGTSAIRDMEAAMMFPHMDKTAPHPQLASPATSRPTRAALTDQSGTESGVQMDFGRSDGEIIENHREEEQGERQQQRRQDPPREEGKSAEPEVQLPEDVTAWAVWGDALETAIANAKSIEAVDDAWKREQPIMKHASKAIRDRLTAIVTKRNTDLALGDDGAAAGDANQSTAAGDDN